MIATAGEDGTVKVFEIGTEDAVTSMQLGQKVNYIAWNPVADGVIAAAPYMNQVDVYSIDAP